MGESLAIKLSEKARVEPDRLVKKLAEASENSLAMKLDDRMN